jgi:glucose/arabinose dehydrogenase
MNLKLGVGATCALICGASWSAAALDVNLEEVASGITAPMAMVSPPGDDRKFIAQQNGFIKILTADGTVLDEPFLDISAKLAPLLSDFDEEGLLGLAFHPDFASNGKFYIAYTGPLNPQGDLGKKLWWAHTAYVSEMSVSKDDPNVADPTNERIISQIDWPQFNHNGHWIGFGKDGMLYISTGDGGYANDWGIGHNPEIGNGQDLLTPLGKILRIDVATGEAAADNPFVGQEDQALPEIWAYGLRNPWRCSFDMGGENDLFCGDVQQNSYEEVSIIEKGGNHGWRVMEAGHCFDFMAPNEHPEECAKADMIMPILEYKNCTAIPEGCEGISVTGGYVYRGSYADWDGKYFFGDWSKSFDKMDGQLFVATKNGAGWEKELVNVANMDGPLPYILAFAQDNQGEVYVLTSVTTGPVGGLDKIYKIVPAS